MKRFLPLIAVLLVLSLFIVGCGKESDPVTIEVGGAASVTDPSTSGSTVIGRVDSIVGNEVILSIGTLDSSDTAAGSETSGRFGGALSDSNMRGGATPGDFASGSDIPQGASGSDMPGGASGTNMPQGVSGSDMPQPVSGTNMPQGASGSDMPQRGSGSDMPGGSAPSGGFNGGSMGGALNVTYTGETATYLLPVGMAIGTGDYSSVTEGMVLQLTIDGDGTITAVSILSR